MLEWGLCRLSRAQAFCFGFLFRFPRKRGGLFLPNYGLGTFWVGCWPVRSCGRELGLPATPHLKSLPFSFMFLRVTTAVTECLVHASFVFICTTT